LRTFEFEEDHRGYTNLISYCLAKRDQEEDKEETPHNPQNNYQIPGAALERELRMLRQMKDLAPEA
jgi:hypothetical protein